MVEAGGIFFANLIKNRLVDEIHLFTSPKTYRGKRNSCN